MDQTQQQQQDASPAAIAQEQQQQPDAVEYFLAHEGERPSYGNTESLADVAEELAEIQVALVEVIVTVAVSAVKFLANTALRRTECLLATQRELERDGRIPGGFVTLSSSASASSASSSSPLSSSSHQRQQWSFTGHVVGSFTAVGACARYLYSTQGGVTAFLRGGKASACFLLASAAQRALQSQLIAGLVSPVVENVLFSLFGPTTTAAATAMRVAWVIGVLPVIVNATAWPLRAVREVVMTNYMADVLGPVPSTTAKRNTNNKSENENDEMNSVTTAIHGGNDNNVDHSMYLYSGVSEVWSTVMRRMGWRGVLCYGWDVGLAHTYAIVFTRLATNYGLAVVLRYLHTPQEERAVGPVWIALALNAAAAASNAAMRPFHVVAARMALLAPEGSNDGNDENENEDEYGNNDDNDGDGGDREHQRYGRRYRSGWHCARCVVRREGLLSLYAGLPQVLLVHTALPALQTLLLGQVVFSVVDFANPM